MADGGLLSEISAHRSSDVQRTATSGVFAGGGRSRFWVEAFVRHFLCARDREDDLVFFVHKTLQDSRHFPRTRVEVFRRDSKRLPLAEPDVDWEETVYLNVIVQHVEYTLTVAVCKRTGRDHLQLLCRRSTCVYASPSRHCMEAKGEAEEMTYPSIFFTVDDYEEVFGDLWLHEGELACVELVGRERDARVLFLGSVGRETLLRSLNRTKVGGGRPGFVRLRGPGGKGHAQLALRDTGWRGKQEQPWRRLSDPSLAASGSSSFDLRRARSQGEGVDLSGEVEASDLRDELGGDCASWGQPFPSGARGSPVGVALTYVALPWHHIVADLLDTRRDPLLTL